MKALFLGALICVVVALPTAPPVTQFRAGASKVDTEVPIGVPLAGINHGERRVKHWPLPHKTKYTTYMTPSEGVLDTTWAKALVIEDADMRKIAFLTFDSVGMDGGLATLALQAAHSRGFGVPAQSTMISGSHTHSGPGAVSSEKLWELAPAMDMLVPELRDHFVSKIADALIQAEQNLVPARMGISFDELHNVTRNRRAGRSPYVTPESIDPILGVIRIDGEDGRAIATVWNYAIHGTCYGESNMKSSADIMGKTSEWVENESGGVALFLNADAGDIAPGYNTCSNPPQFDGAAIIGSKISTVRASTTTSSNVTIHGDSQIVDFGPTNLNATFQRMANCTTGPICGLCEILQCNANLHLKSDWVEESPKFTAFKFEIDGEKIGAVSIPGEAIHELGDEIRSDAKELGFQHTLLCGYTNNHMGYFTTPREYEAGGYESQMTFWGEDTSERVRRGCRNALTSVTDL